MDDFDLVLTDHGSYQIYTTLAQMPWDGTKKITFSDYDPNEKKTTTDAQQHLAQMWYDDIAGQTHNEREYERARCKLEHGIPILRRNPDIRRVYDKMLKPFSYEDKIDFIRQMDLPVTRKPLMKKGDMQEYLTAIDVQCMNNGIHLRKPLDVWEVAMR